MSLEKDVFSATRLQPWLRVEERKGPKMGWSEMRLPKWKNKVGRMLERKFSYRSGGLNRHGRKAL